SPNEWVYCGSRFGLPTRRLSGSVDSSIGFRVHGGGRRVRRVYDSRIRRPLPISYVRLALGKKSTPEFSKTSPVGTSKRVSPCRTRVPSWTPRGPSLPARVT